MACQTDLSTILIFLPKQVEFVEKVFLHGDVVFTDTTVSVYVTKVCRKKCKSCSGVYTVLLGDGGGDASSSTWFPSSSCWFHLERRDKSVTLKTFRDSTDPSRNGFGSVGVVVIYYDRDTLEECQDSNLVCRSDRICDRDHFRSLIWRLRRLNRKRRRKGTGRLKLRALNVFLHLFRSVVLALSTMSKKALFVTRHSNFAVQLDNYMTGYLWATESSESDGREGIKMLNFLCSVLLDFIVGIFFLNWVTLRFADAFPKFVIFLAETIAQSLRDLMHWLTGDPAGFKLNYDFSKTLASCILYYIEIWWSFIDILKPAYRHIFQVFLVLGKAGVTFQVSIILDLLSVVTFHIYSVCILAARLYNFQMRALIALWRLFLGRKKNPLRKRVDSCKYTPEQLFMGTLGFTILLFLLPTTLIYYVVFTFLRVIITALRGILIRIRYFVHWLPVYSSFLWLIGSPKVCSGIHLIPYRSWPSAIIFYVKPVCKSWKDAISCDAPKFIDVPQDFKFSDFMYSLLIGRVK